jgi:hypothetical protein
MSSSLPARCRRQRAGEDLLPACRPPSGITIDFDRNLLISLVVKLPSQTISRRLAPDQGIRCNHKDLNIRIEK